MLCKYCGGTLSSDNQYCLKCGQVQIESYNDDNSKYWNAVRSSFREYYKSVDNIEQGIKNRESEMINAINRRYESTVALTLGRQRIVGIVGIAFLVLLVCSAIAFYKIDYLKAVNDYNTAIELISKGDYKEAKDILGDLKYKDSESLLLDLELKDPDLGQVVTLGQYDQDKTTPGLEDIRWRVIKKKKHSCLLLSECCVDYSDIHYSGEASKYLSLDWTESSLYEWLQNDFLDNAFSDEELHHINKTKKRGFLFLLTSDEANEFFTSNKERIVKNYSGDSSSAWWLCDDIQCEPSGKCYAKFVDKKGVVRSGLASENNYGVRPALWYNYE